MGLFNRSKKSSTVEDVHSPSLSTPQPPVRRVGLDNPEPISNNNNNNNPSTRPPRVQDVAGVIGFSCAQSSFDFAYILALCDYISSSTVESTKAAKALRKEIKYAVPDAQERAVRLMGIMCRNSSDRFKQQIVTKKFLSELSDMATNKKTEPRVLAMVIRVLSPLAFEFQHDRDLLPLTTLYNKLKPESLPTNGLPLAEDDDLFTPTNGRQAQSQRRTRQQYQTEMPTKEEQLKWLQKKANEAKGNAGMLNEALAFAVQIEGNELVAEFYAKCFSSQETIVSNLEWCSIEAEQSRSSQSTQVEPLSVESLEISPAPVTTNQYKSHNPFAPIIEADLPRSSPTTTTTPKPAQQEPTEEELTYAMLLSAHSDITESLLLHDTTLAHSKEAAELVRIQERSKDDTRVNQVGAIQEVGESSGEIRDTNNVRRQSNTNNPYNKFRFQSSTPPQQASNNNTYTNTNENQGGYLMDEPESTLEKYEPLTPSSPPRISSEISTAQNGTSSSKYSDLGVDGYREEEVRSGNEELRRRLGPSDKALGKLRKVSEREDNNGIDQQAALEEALRAKYRE